MILDVHVAFLVASLSVMLGLTYSIGRFLDIKIEELRERKAGNTPTSTKIEVLVS